MKLLEAITTTVLTGGFKTVTCSREGCSRWLTQRHLATRRVGVSFKGKWYCCYRCFAAPAQAHFVTLLSAHPASSSKHSFSMPLGLSMMSRGLLNDSQLRRVNEEHRKSGEEVGDLVFRMGFVDEKQLTMARAAQWGAPVYSMPSRSIPSSVHVPTTLMKIHSMIPLRHSQTTNTLMVGFVNGVEYGPLYAIEQMTKCKAQPCFLTPTDFWEQMETQKQALSPEELTFEAVSGPAEMARIVCNYGALKDASEVAVVRCREYIWTRVFGGAKSADLLFKVD